MAEALEIKTKLDFIACLNIIKRRESHNWLKSRNIISDLEELFDSGLSNDEQNSLEEFKENGALLSQTLQWVPIEKLHVVDPSFKLGIKKSPYLLHEDFKNLFAEFELKELEAEDFEFDPKDKNEDTHLRYIIKDRAKFLAFLMDENEWKDVLTDILHETELLKFFTCKKISLTYKESDIEIENSDFDFYTPEGSDEYYFIGRWDRVRAADMYPCLYKRLKLKDPVSEKVFKDILFADSIEDILDYFKENNIGLPYELDPNARKIEPINTIRDNGSPSQQNGEEDINKPSLENLKDITSEHKGDVDKHQLIEGPEYENYDLESHEVEKYSEVKEGLLTGRIDLPLEEQIIVHNDSVSDAKFYLENLGYDFSKSDDIGYKTTDIISPEGDNVNFIFRSATGGLLHLNLYHWEELDTANTFMLVSIPSNGFRIFSSKIELLEDTLNNNLLFRFNNTKNESEVDNLFQSLEDKDGQLILVTNQEMRSKLHEQFNNQKNNESIDNPANVENLDY
jgi:hypothetical protein